MSLFLYILAKNGLLRLLIQWIFSVWCLLITLINFRIRNNSDYKVISSPYFNGLDFIYSIVKFSLLFLKVKLPRLSCHFSIIHIIRFDNSRNEGNLAKKSRITFLYYDFSIKPTKSIYLYSIWLDNPWSYQYSCLKEPFLYFVKEVFECKRITSTKNILKRRAGG
jgi:hypothetical protein